MSSEDFDPKGKGHLLALHILEKGFQAGGIIGGVIVCPIVAYRLGVRDPNLLKRLVNAMAVSALAGTALAGAAGAAKVYGTNVSNEGIEDRVYRLHYNAGQNRTDKFAAISGLVGAVATAGLLDTRNPRLLLGGAAAGAAMGVLAHAATYREEAGRPNAMLEEMKSRE